MNEQKTPDLTEVLNRDPLRDLEKMTGKSYKDLPDLVVLGAGLRGVAAKRQAVEAAGDLPFGYDLAAGMPVFVELGFKIVHEIPFKGVSWNGEPEPDERLIYMLHPAPALLVIETYQGTRINAVGVNFCGTVKDEDKFYSICMSRGRNAEGVFDCHMAMTEAPKHWWKTICESVDFVPVWTRSLFLRLLDHKSWKLPKEQYEAIDRERYAALPDVLKTMIKPGSRMTEFKRDIKPEIAAAVAKWWRTRLQGLPGRNNGAGPNDMGGPFGQGLIALEALTAKKASDEQLDLFEKKLTDYILAKQCRDLDVDYHPGWGLSDIAKEVGISESRFPWKTHTRIYHVFAEARLGYGAKAEVIAGAKPFCAATHIGDHYVNTTSEDNELWTTYQTIYPPDGLGYSYPRVETFSAAAAAAAHEYEVSDVTEALAKAGPAPADMDNAEYEKADKAKRDAWFAARDQHKRAVQVAYAAIRATP